MPEKPIKHIRNASVLENNSVGKFKDLSKNYGQIIEGGFMPKNASGGVIKIKQNHYQKMKDGYKEKVNKSAYSTNNNTSQKQCSLKYGI